MGGTEEKGETVAQMVGYDLEGILRRLTGEGVWEEVEHPGSGVGVEYFFESTLFKSVEAKEDGENPGHERDDEDASRILSAYICIDHERMTVAVTDGYGEEAASLELDMSDLRDSGYEEFVRRHQAPSASP